MSARNPGGAEIRVSNPSKGLVTRIPSDQPPERKIPSAWVVAQNVRFDDGVIRNAPGYEDIEMLPTPTTPILGIFQEQLIESDKPPFKNPIIITGDKIYWVQRGVYTPPDIMTVGIPSEESFGSLVVVSATNGYIVPSGISSSESVSNVTIT